MHLFQELKDHLEGMLAHARAGGRNTIEQLETALEKLVGIQPHVTPAGASNATAPSVMHDPTVGAGEPVILVTMSHLKAALAKWEQDARDGLTLSHVEAAALSVEQVVEGGAQLLWAHLQSLLPQPVESADGGTAQPGQMVDGSSSAGVSSGSVTAIDDGAAGCTNTAPGTTESNPDATGAGAPSGASADASSSGSTASAAS